MKKSFIKIITLITFGISQSFFVTAQTNAALNFDGEDDYIQTDKIISHGNNFTYEALVNLNNPVDWAGIITSATPGDNRDSYLQITQNPSGLLKAEMYSQGNYKWALGSTALTGAWHHIAVTFDGATVKMYVDGLAESVTMSKDEDMSTFSISHPILIGAERNLNVYSNLSIDNVRIWNVARSQSEIQSKMHCKVDYANNLILNFNLNEGFPNKNNLGIDSVISSAGNNQTFGVLNNFNLTGTTSNFINSSYGENSMVQKQIVYNGSHAYQGLGDDFNGDGYKDLLLGDWDGNVRMYFNNGDGSFPLNYTTFAYNVLYTSMNSGDIDNDGDIDILASTGGILKVFLNDGSGVFTPMNTSVMNGDGNSNVTYIIDINNDGKKDIIWGNESSGGNNYTEVWLNTGTTGNPTFTFSSNVYSSAKTQALAFGDIDGDNDIDILAGTDNGSFTFLNNGNDGTFTKEDDIPEYSGHVYLIDWDKDGDLDYMVYNKYNNFGLRVRRNDGTGHFESTSTFLVADYEANRCRLSDLNGDGFIDAVLDQWDGNALIYLNTGCGLVLLEDCKYQLGIAHNGVILADFNNDKKIDIFCAARGTASTLFINNLDSVTAVPLSTIISTTPAKICGYGKATLKATASNGGEINWYDDPNSNNNWQFKGDTYVTGNLNSDRTYYIDAKNANGCVSPRVEIKVTVGTNTTGDTTATSCGNFMWHGQNYTLTGNYKDTLTNVGGCDSIVTLHLTIHEFNLNVSVNGNTLKSEALNATSLQWINCNTKTPINGQTNSTFTPESNGDYAVIVTTANCSDTSACVYIGLTDISNNISNEVSVYPNPSTGIVNVSVSSNATLSVMDIYGKVVFAKSLSNGLNTLNLSHLETGVYVFKIASSGVSVKSILISK